MDFTIIATATYTEDRSKSFFIYSHSSEPTKLLLIEVEEYMKTIALDYLEVPIIENQIYMNRDFKSQSLYRHYKNKDYLSLYIATHVKTGVQYAIYTSLYMIDGMLGKVWARELSMFLEPVECNENNILRFTEL